MTQQRRLLQASARMFWKHVSAKIHAPRCSLQLFTVPKTREPPTDLRWVKPSDICQAEKVGNHTISLYVGWKPKPTTKNSQTQTTAWWSPEGRGRGQGEAGHGVADGVQKETGLGQARGAIYGRHAAESRARDLWDFIN